MLRALFTSPIHVARKIVERVTELTSAAIFLRKSTSVGPGARSVGRPIVRNDGRLVIGRELRLTSTWNPVELRAAEGASLEIGDHVNINYGALIFARRKIRLGNRAQIGNLCVIADSEVPIEGVAAERMAEPQPIEIGDDVWLAARVTVLPGTTIGEGAVITAGSIVSGTIPRRVVAGGIPARVIRSLDVDEASDAGDGETAIATVAPVIPASTASAASASLVAAASPEPQTPEARGTVIADFTVDELAQALRRSPNRPFVDVRVAPFNTVTQTLLGGPAVDARDFAVVWTRPDAAIPAFGRLVESEAAPLDEILSEVDAFVDLITRGAGDYRFVFVPTWTMPDAHRGLGLLDGREGILRALTAMNLRLMERLSASNKIHVLDAQRWISRAGSPSYSPKGWYMGKLAFPMEVFEEAARDIKAAIGALTGLARKVIAVDLDDTMWGGTVGEQGWQSLRLGGHDPHGEGFIDFQRALKALARRGVLLVVVSKNEEAVALEAIDRHPEMLLRRKDFVSWRINWRDKAQNIADLAAELNLGLQSFVFLDNDTVERARVREALPEVLVPEWPADPMLYRNALHALTCFDVPALTQSDANRSELYAAERERERLKTEVGSLDDWLKSLDMKVRVEELSKANLPRVTQLFNKTNQMNLSTRRMTADELVEWTSHDNRKLWALTVSDRFGDAGLTGVLSFEANGSRGKIVDFILSCRVMGRKVENTMLHLAVEHARRIGLRTVEARYLQTTKNKPCLEFWQRSGFTADGDSVFEWNTESDYALPSAIQLERELQHVE